MAQGDRDDRRRPAACGQAACGLTGDARLTALDENANPVVDGHRNLPADGNKDRTGGGRFAYWP
jgi:hypothetical protein